MPKATREELEDLHSKLTEYFIEMLENPPDDAVIRASHLAEVRQFLKDNNVTKDVVSGKDLKQSLSELTHLNFPLLPDPGASH